MYRLLISMLTLAIASPAFAQDPPPAPPPVEAPAPEPRANEAPPQEESPAPTIPPAAPKEFDPTRPTAAPGSPRPDAVSGIAVPEAEPLAKTLRWIPRVALYIPRWTLWIIAQPVRIAAWTFEHYNLQARVKGILFNYDGTYGLYPVATYSTDFGLDVGLRFVHKSLFGEGEHLRLRLNFGGSYQQTYGMTLQSGERFGKRFNMTLDTTYERRPNERFYGIGNENELATVPTMPLDPTLPDSISSSRFRENWFRAVLRGEVKLVGQLSVRAAGALARRRFDNYAGSDPFDPTDPVDPTAGKGIEERFDTSKLVGYDRGVDNIYAELELVYDSRRQANRYAPAVLESTGWYADAHLGRAFGVQGDPTALWRYGGEVQRIFDLYRGSRFLTLRAMYDGVVGGDGRTDTTISFIDLPRLGGTSLLRGYADGRFRDRILNLATAEYTWDLGNYYAAYLFVDAGRVYEKISKFDLNSMHLGYGVGIHLYAGNTYFLRGQLAFSREGDMFVEVAYSPNFGRRERAGRY